MKKVWIILFFILVLASVLRFWQIGKTPIAPDWDEVSLGYNAYSILLTGKDEYGKFLPVIIRSFDDYKPALYSYLVIPSVKILGLNLVAVRIPSAIFGILAVFVTFFLVKELFKKENLALFSSFLLAISPWHIQFSRVGFEANVGVTLNLLFVLFFLKAFKNPKFLLLSSLFAGLSLHAYQSEKVFVPLLLFVMLIIFRKEFISIPRKYITLSFIIGLILIIPIAWFILTNRNALLRAQGVSIFSDETPFLSRTVKKLQNDSLTNDKLGLILDNRRVTYAFSIASGYLSHFDLNWLFIRGDLGRHHAPEMALLYLFELPFLLTGLYKLAFGDFDKKTKLFIFSWFLIVPIPASITTGVPHPIRTLNFLPLWQVFISVGVITFLAYLKSKKPILRASAIFIISFVALFNFVYYLNQYFVQQNYFTAQDWQYGYKKIVAELKTLKNVNKIVVSNKGNMDQSYMFFLFYLKYDPFTYQREASYNSSGGFRETHKFGIYEFRPIYWGSEERGNGTIYIGTPNDFPSNTESIYSVYYPDGNKAMEIIK